MKEPPEYGLLLCSGGFLYVGLVESTTSLLTREDLCVIIII